MDSVLRKIRQRKGILVILSAPSGSGKTTICKALLKSIPSLEYSISYTTRQARSKERNKKDYYFISKERFKDMRKRGCFAEWALVHGNYYGTHAKTVINSLNKGKDILLDLDVAGTKKIKKKYKSTVSIFVTPPSMDELKKRLKTRGGNSKGEIKKRLDRALQEISKIQEYDYIVLNDQVETALSNIKAIIRAEKAKVSRLLPNRKTLKK